MFARAYLYGYYSVLLSCQGVAMRLLGCSRGLLEHMVTNVF